MSCDLNDYKCSDLGLFLPMVNEYTWSVEIKAVVYLVGLLWSFMGVSIIADVFMQAIETITSRTKVVVMADPKSPTGKTEVSVKVWNNTVANLTLMALGSSAPEILLSVIEIVGNDFVSKELGPGTIVGSAAFNLFVITGVCVIAIPSGEKRRIEAIKVFGLTAFFSVFAYIWLIVILVLITPDFVDLWEAVLTLAFFPLLVLLSYIADKEFCFKSKTKRREETEFGLGHEQWTSTPSRKQGQTGKRQIKSEKGNVEMVDKHTNVVDAIKKLTKRPDLSEAEEARIASALIAKQTPHNRAWYRINAIRNLTGGHKLVPAVNDKQEEILHALETGKDVSASSISLAADSSFGEKAVIEWAAAETAVMERDGRARMSLLRHGNLDVQVLVKVETVNGTAEAGSDYVGIKKTLVFEPGVTSQDIDVEIIDDDEWEPDEVFFVKASVELDQHAQLGSRPICQVTIVNDDDPGTFEFAKPSFVFKESAGKALVQVDRKNGCDGKASVFWETRDQTGPRAAMAGKDYVKASGELCFKHGELSKFIEITIIDDQDFEKDEHFDVALTKCSEGAHLGHLTRTVITILNDDDFKGAISRIVNLTSANLDQISMSHATWGKQFEDAMNVNGGDIENATAFDYVMHFITFGWKVIFALVPPPHIWGGWLSFFVSLGMIGLLTAIVGDLAGIFGCLIGLKPTVTAITFVALGTSLPDLFASKQAAVQEENADNSVGNVTGSNAVNVFLGLGLPWTIAAIYWGMKGASFEVSAGSLSFSVILYSVCAVAVILLLMLRRWIPALGQAELGGPAISKYLSAAFMIILWFLYVILSSLQSYEIIETTF